MTCIAPCDIICTYVCDFWKYFLSNINTKKKLGSTYSIIYLNSTICNNWISYIQKQKQKFTERSDLGSTEPYINHSLTWQTIDVHIYWNIYNKRIPLQYNEFQALILGSHMVKILIGLINYNCTVSILKQDV